MFQSNRSENKWEKIIKYSIRSELGLAHRSADAYRHCMRATCTKCSSYAAGIRKHMLSRCSPSSSEY